MRYSIYNHVYKYFEKESVNSKYRRPSKLTSKTAEVTGYSESTVRRIVAERLEISGAAFMSPPKRYKGREDEYDTGWFDTETLWQFAHYF